MDIIPAIDIKDGKCVRLFQGNYSKEKVFGNNLLEIASKWIDLGAKRLHIVDLDGAKHGSQKNISIIKKLVEFSDIPLQIGGGVRKFSDAKYLFELGVDKIILGTSAVKNPNEIVSTIEKFGSEFVIVGIDAKNGMVQTNGWLFESELKSNILFNNMINLGVEQFIYTDVTRDGTLSEPNYQQIIEILENFKVKLTVAGGVANINQLVKLKNIGVDSAISGMALNTATVSSGMLFVSVESKINNMLNPTLEETFDPQSMIALIPIHCEQKVADIGSGPGWLSIPLAKYLYLGKCISVDIQNEMLKKVKSQAKKYKLGNIQTILSEENKIPIDDDSVEGVVFSDILNEAKNIEKILKEGIRILKKSGWLCVVEWLPSEDSKPKYGPNKSSRLKQEDLRKKLEDNGLSTITSRHLTQHKYIIVARKK